MKNCFYLEQQIMNSNYKRHNKLGAYTVKLCNIYRQCEMWKFGIITKSSHFSGKDFVFQEIVDIKRTLKIKSCPGIY